MVDGTRVTQVECATNAMKKVSEKINEVKREHDDAVFLQNVQEPGQKYFKPFSAESILIITLLRKLSTKD